MAREANDWSFPEVTDDIVRRYRDNYVLSADVPVTKDMVFRHMDLEYRLTQTLLNSLPEERRKVWVSSYDQLYRELPWLAKSSTSELHGVDLEYGHLLKLIPPGARVIDIGSGVGHLATYLNDHGRPCVATDITFERGLREDGAVTWHETDGIHLGDFEPHGTFDVVISMQVVEHFHPDDMEEHFRGAMALLRPGGQYVFTTPHAFLGPADLSKVFSLNRPRFMHLKEYTHRELGAIAHRAGFRDIAAVYIPPSAIRRRLPFVLRSRFLYSYLSAMERLLGGIRLPNLMLRGLLFNGDVFMTVTK